jgi:hypothetical protein
MTDKGFLFDFERDGIKYSVTIEPTICKPDSLYKELTQYSLDNHRKPWENIVYNCIKYKMEMPGFSVKLHSKLKC